MPKELALAFSLAAIAWLFRKDTRWRITGSNALWLPGIFLAIIASRPLPYWLGMGGGIQNLEGSPANTAFFAFLIFAAFAVLSVRRFDWGSWCLKNWAIVGIYTYFAISAFWSEDPSVSLKRLTKDFVCVLMALIILTEITCVAAIRGLFVRVCYLLFVFSWLFGKYFPEIGRSSARNGEVMFTGVTTQKNSLGQITFLFGLIILWELLDWRRQQAWKFDRQRVMIDLGVFLLGLWLLAACDSKTSLLCLLIGAIVLWGSERLTRMRNGKRVLFTSLGAAASMVVFDRSVGLSEWLLEVLDRSPTLTGRTEIWKMALANQVDPAFGGGFYMFWDTAPGREVIDTLVTLNSAHSGYIETYLDGGVVGCIFLAVMVLAMGKRVIDRLFDTHPLGGIGLAIWITAIIYNYSESSFLRLEPLWFTLLLVTMDVPQAVITGKSQTAAITRPASAR